MSRREQLKGAAAERELADFLRRAGYPARWGGNRTFGSVPDISGLPGVHVEVKAVERLDLYGAVEQSERDAERFRDGAPTVFHRRQGRPWLVTMPLRDWMRLYGAAASPVDQHAHAFFTERNRELSGTERRGIMYWENEKPITATTAKNELEYYRDAGKLSVAKPSWTNGSGETRRGKCVVLDLEAVRNCPDAVRIIKAIAGNL